MSDTDDEGRSDVRQEVLGYAKDNIDGSKVAKVITEWAADLITETFRQYREDGAWVCYGNSSEHPEKLEYTSIGAWDSDPLRVTVLPDNLAKAMIARARCNPHEDDRAQVIAALGLWRAAIDRAAAEIAAME